MILAGESARNSFRPDTFIAEKAEAGKLGEILFLVPTNRRRRSLEFELSAASPSRACANLRVHTLDSCTCAMLSDACVPFEPVPEAAAILILQSVLKEIAREGYFSKYRDYTPEGILRVLRQLFAKWKRHQLTGAQIAAEIEPSAPQHEKEKLMACISVYEKYCAELARHGFHEAGDINALFIQETERMEAAFKKLFPAVRYILVSGYSEFAPVEAALLLSLSRVSGTETFIDLDAYSANPFLFGAVKETAECLVAAGFKEITDERPMPNAYIERIKKRLFHFDTPSAPRGMRVTKLSAANHEEEIRCIAKIIRAMLVEGKVRPSGICVSINLIREYSPVIRSIFGAAGIPFTLTDRPLLASSPVVTAIIHFLEIETSRYYYHAICKAHSGGFFRLKNSSVTAILNTATRHGVIAGYNEWMNLAAVVETDDENGDSAAEGVRQDIMEIHRRLVPFAGQLTPAAFSKAFDEFIFSMRLADSISANTLPGNAAVFSAVNGLRAMVKELCAILAKTETPAAARPLSYYLKQITDAVSYVRYTVIEPPRDTVLITTPEEIRGLKFDYLFLAGLYDGNFPSRFIPELFSPKTMARDESGYIAGQQYLFYQTLCAAGKALCLSYPRAGGTRDMYPSVFLAAFERLFTTEAVDTAALRDTAIDNAEILTAAAKWMKEEKALDAFSEYLPLPEDELREMHAIDLARLSGAPEAAEYAGILDTDALNSAALETLAAAPEKEYSVSQLESYTACPFKFFLRRMLYILTPDMPEEEDTRKELGTVLHTIFFEFYNNRDIKKRALSALSEAGKKKAYSELFEVAKKIIEETPEGKVLGSWDREVILGIHGNKEASLLHKFFEVECAEEGITPVLLEAGFGRLSAEARQHEGGGSSEPVLLGGIKLTGKIDRVEVNADEGTFNVVDYKSSFNQKKFSQKAMEDGLYLQLPVYLHAAAELLKKNPAFAQELVPFQAVIYSLKYRADKFGKAYLLKSKEKDAEANARAVRAMALHLIQNAEEHISRAINEIAGGKFPLTTLEGTDREEFACQYCEYSRACRVDERA